MTEINPVTEPEVMSFAQRIVTTIVSVSQQARDIDNLRFRLDNLMLDFNQLRDENEKLKKEVAETWEFVKTVEAERDQAKRNAELSEARVAEAQQDAARAWDERNKLNNELNETVDRMSAQSRNRDERIAELERELSETRSHNASLKATNEEQAFRIVSQGDRLESIKRDKEGLLVELHDTTSRLDKAQSKLASVQSELASFENKVRSLFDSPKEATPEMTPNDAALLRF